MRETERIEKIVNALLQLARLEGLGRAVGKPVELKTFIESNFAVPVKGQGQVWADPNLLQLALQNLVANAQIHGKSSPSVELEAYGKGVWIWVCDRGPGFAPELLPEAFAPFKKTGSGTGLGLTLVAEVANVHGGKVKAQNRPGAGAQVGIWLPSA
jgi:two-component system sensor histidine kinase TctE